jgi:S-DNA-T family DNA segregation ATPase FtsK/SpoIIIE
LSDDEIDAVTDSVSTDEHQFVKELVEMKVEDGDDNQPEALKKRDDLYESAVDVVVREGRGSVSLLQRTLGIGYGRAARLIDFMAEDKIVGEYAGSQAREVLISLADWERMQHGESTEEEGDEQLSVYDDKSTAAKPQDQSADESEEHDETEAEEYDDEYEEEEYEEEDAEYEYQ